MNEDKDPFERFTESKRVSDGCYEIKCTKGLWAVVATTKPQALNEAHHYFRQYYADGEYND